MIIMHHAIIFLLVFPQFYTNVPYHPTADNMGQNSKSSYSHYAFNICIYSLAKFNFCFFTLDVNIYVFMNGFRLHIRDTVIDTRHTQQTRDIHPMLFQCLASVEVGTPTLKRHWVNAGAGRRSRLYKLSDTFNN